MPLLQLISRQVGAQDISWGTGSFSYVDENGISRTMQQVNASNIVTSGGGTLGVISVDSNTGSVGIGKAPGYTFEVLGSDAKFTKSGSSFHLYVGQTLALVDDGSYGTVQSQSSVDLHLYNTQGKGIVILNGSTGYVGIGTDSPTAPLFVQRPNDGGDILRLSNDTINYYAFARSNATGNLSIQGNQVAPYNNIVLCPSSGFVGVGAVPTDKFCVAGNVLIGPSGNSPYNAPLTLFNSANNTAQWLTMAYGTAGNYKEINLGIVGNINDFITGSAVGDGVLKSVYGGLLFVVGTTLVMRIKSTGVTNIAGLASYANNGAALAGGLVAGDLYRIGDTVGIVH